MGPPLEFGAIVGGKALTFVQRFDSSRKETFEEKKKEKIRNEKRS